MTNFIRHYYCINCHKDLSCKSDRRWDFVGEKIVYKDRCPNCGGEIDAGFPSEKCNVDISSRGKGFWSWSMGVHVDQIPEAVKAYPDRKYNMKGQLWVENPQHRGKLAKEHNMVELDRSELRQ